MNTDTNTFDSFVDNDNAKRFKRLSVNERFTIKGVEFKVVEIDTGAKPGRFTAEMVPDAPDRQDFDDTMNRAERRRQRALDRKR